MASRRHSHRLNGLAEIDTLRDRHQLPELTPHEVENPDSPTSVKGNEFVKSSHKEKTAPGPEEFHWKFHQNLRKKLYQFYTVCCRK